ncbi:serine/arginine-rich splicing factor RS40 [Syzygium oleosum]|uniref:serine/arginine-rich splicing factor RS40 n=1 Tax=Syzygium oleosum TaxID=219896 RepID=UPI0024B9BDD4|nr:serine/arginine-rich splicing factor RS40 [Syzygium oleosum]
MRELFEENIFFFFFFIFESCSVRVSEEASGGSHRPPPRRRKRGIAELCEKLLLRKMRPIFCGNFEYDARPSELERLFRRYGKVDKVDMKSGFAFVYMDDERDAEDAIRGLDRIEFGRKGRRLRVEWTKHERGVRKPSGSRRSSTTMRPSKTLFVINFDTYQTRTRDLERHFEPYGKIVSVRIRRNFAFVQYEYQEDATKALDATNMSKLMDRVISVEYAARDDDDKKDGYSPDRGRGRSPERGYDRKRSPSPYKRDRGSPDYGQGASPSRRERGSPNYGRESSPIDRQARRASPNYGRGSSRSPRRRERSLSGGSRSRSRSCSRSPYKRQMVSRGNGRDRSHSPYEKPAVGPNNGPDRNRSLDRGEESPENGREPLTDRNGDAARDVGVESPASGGRHSYSPAAED